MSSDTVARPTHLAFGKLGDARYPNNPPTAFRCLVAPALLFKGIQIKAEDLDWDYVKMLPDLLPMLRNDYAHGSTDLHNWALRSFQIVSEVINQLYQPPA